MAKNNGHTRIKFQNNKILYVEPNYSEGLGDKTTDKSQTVLQAPHLEDYCLTVDLEVELVDRNGNYSTSNQQRFMVMHWSNDNNSSRISFMSGSRVYTSAEKKRNINHQNIANIIGTHRKDAHGNYNYVNSFTTDYNDCYYDAIIQHGTTELFGIKSIDIDHKNRCVSHVVMQFTDIRGASLFANTEKRKSNQYVSYENLDGDEMAQVFFQCFFTVPYPKFNLTVKGYYGEPVTYELNCNAIKTTFNSKTGNFEATVDFIGYYFEFLNDVPMTALLAAPQTPTGEKYWKANFHLDDGQQLPTLVYVYRMMDEIYRKIEKPSATTDKNVEVEKRRDSDKINKINACLSAHQDLLKRIEECCSSYGHCVLNIQDKGNHTKSNSLDTSPFLFACLVSHDFAEKTFLDFIKQDAEVRNHANKVLKALQEANKLLDTNISGDIDWETRPIAAFEWKEDGTITIDSKQWDGNGNYKLIADKINNLNTYRNKYTENYVYILDFGYIWELISYYLEIGTEIAQLKENPVAIIANNRLSFELGERFSIELFIKIILAHFETLMHLMYTCVEKINESNRTIERLKCPSRHFGDVNFGEMDVNKVIIPPFPLLTINTTNANDERIIETTTTWPGVFENSKFQETALVKELLLGATMVSSEIHAIDEKEAKKYLPKKEYFPGEELELEDVVAVEPESKISHLVNVSDGFMLAANDLPPFPQDVKITTNTTDFYEAIGRRAYETINLDYLSSLKAYIAQQHSTPTYADLGQKDGANFVHQFPIQESDIPSYVYRQLMEGGDAIDGEGIWNTLIQQGFIVAIPSITSFDSSTLSASNSAKKQQRRQVASLSQQLPQNGDAEYYTIKSDDTYLRKLPSYHLITQKDKIENLEEWTKKIDKLKEDFHTDVDDLIQKTLKDMYFQPTVYDRIFKGDSQLALKKDGVPIKGEVKGVGDKLQKGKPGPTYVCGVKGYHKDKDKKNKYDKTKLTKIAVTEKERAHENVKSSAPKTTPEAADATAVARIPIKKIIPVTKPKKARVAPKKNTPKKNNTNNQTFFQWLTPKKREEWKSRYRTRPLGSTQILKFKPVEGSPGYVWGARHIEKDYLVNDNGEVIGWADKSSTQPYDPRGVKVKQRKNWHYCHGWARIGRDGVVLEDKMASFIFTTDKTFYRVRKARNANYWLKVGYYPKGYCITIPKAEGEKGKPYTIWETRSIVITFINSLGFYYVYSSSAAFHMFPYHEYHNPDLIQWMKERGVGGVEKAKRLLGKSQTYSAPSPKTEVIELQQQVSAAPATLSQLLTQRDEQSKILSSAIILCCINAYDWTYISNYIQPEDDYLGERPCLIVPHLLVLQMGAVLWVHDTYELALTADAILTKLPFTNTEIFYQYLGSLNSDIQKAIKEHFLEYVKGEKVIQIYNTYFNNSHTLPPSQPLYDWSDDMLRPVALVKALATAEAGVGLGHEKMHHFTKTNFIEYANGFLKYLRGHWKIKTERKQKEVSGSIKTRLISGVTDDMCTSLYGYLKQLYDRWIPNFRQDEWKMANFFQDAPKGLSFHFIDAYFTPIGNTVRINMQTVKDAIHNLVQLNSFNANMFEFITTVLQHNNFMVMCTNNFTDLANKDKMQKLFNPVPYLEYAPPKRHPDFVCVYTYRPSQQLNTGNGSYKDDSFMVDGSNQEDMPYPLLIKNTTDNNVDYKLPAFGVSYGMQYQNYFTDIQVDTNSAQLTEVALKTQYGIIGDNQRMGGRGCNFLGQDLFDIYSSQSYKCTIKMLGNTWIQPLMYFCLLNVPMFRGSYWISEVSHHVEPKTMTTTVQGIRMSKYASPFTVETIIIGENRQGGGDFNPTNKSYVSNAGRYYSTPSAHGTPTIVETPTEIIIPEDDLTQMSNLGDRRSFLHQSVISTHYWRRESYKLRSANQYADIGDALAHCIAGEDSSTVMSIYIHALCFYNESLSSSIRLCDRKRWNAYNSSKSTLATSALSSARSGKWGVECKSFTTTSQAIAFIRTIIECVFRNPMCILVFNNGQTNGLIGSLHYNGRLYPYTNTVFWPRRMGTYVRGRAPVGNFKHQLTAEDLPRLKHTIAYWCYQLKRGRGFHAGLDLIANESYTMFLDEFDVDNKWHAVSKTTASVPNISTEVSTIDTDIPLAASKGIFNEHQLLSAPNHQFNVNIDNVVTSQTLKTYIDRLFSSASVSYSLDSVHLPYEIIEATSNKIIVKLVLDNQAISSFAILKYLLLHPNYLSKLIWIIDDVNDIINPDPISIIAEFITDKEQAHNILQIGMGTSLTNNLISGDYQSEYEISLNYYYAIALYYNSVRPDYYHAHVITKANNNGVYGHNSDTNEVNAKKIENNFDASKISKQTVTLLGSVGDFNAKAAADFLLNNASNVYDASKCGQSLNAIKSALVVGSISYDLVSNVNNSILLPQSLQNAGFDIICSGESISNETYNYVMSHAQLGDICVFATTSNSFHCTMYCGTQWCSDYKQGQQATLQIGGQSSKYWIYLRYSGNGGVSAYKRPSTVNMPWASCTKRNGNYPLTVHYVK